MQLYIRPVVYSPSIAPSRAPQNLQLNSHPWGNRTFMLASLDQHAYNFGVEKDQDRHLVSPNPSRVGKLRIA